MYMFIVLAVLGIAISLAFYFRVKRANKLENERVEGKWDFIDGEYLPYLESHKEPVKKIEKASMTIKTSYADWIGNGTISYNAAGVHFEINSVGYPVEVVFARGEKRHAKFSPLEEFHFASIEKSDKDKIILNFKTKANREKAEYTLTINNAPAELFDGLKIALG